MSATLDLYEPASSSDASTLAGMLIVLAIVAVGAVWAWRADADDPDLVTITTLPDLRLNGIDPDELQRSIDAHPSNGGRS